MTLSANINGKMIDLPTKIELLWWQAKGLSCTRSGYGRRIPTRYMVELNGRWRRVYCCIFSNAGTCYVEGAKKPGGSREWIVVS